MPRIDPRPWRRRTFPLVAVAAVALLAGSAAAQPRIEIDEPVSVEPDADRPRPKKIQVTRIRGGTPEIDGRLDDDVWGQASWITDFQQKEPDQFADPTLRTEVAFLYDRDAIYIGARLHHEDPAEIGDQMTRRDEIGTTERLIVSLDTYHDRRTAYSFAVTAAGARLDWYHPTDSETSRDYTFDPVWAAETEIGSRGWTAEMRIPFSQLRFGGGERQLWGVNLNRFVPARNEDIFWIVVPREETGWASRFGQLVGIGELPANRRVEVMPYFASDARFTSDGLLDEDDPFHDGTEMEARTGLDFKMGLGPSLTLDATVNPDFGQVEADPAEVNLSAFETFFDERRPFFTEGQQNFEGHGSSFYYSRRIGAAPHGSVDGDFVESPQTTTILGAAKITGQTEAGLTIGALGAVTDDETARAFDLETGAFDELEVEPLTTYGIVRLQQQFGADQSTIGGTLTSVRRALDADDPVDDVLVREAYAGGIDWNRRFDGGAYELLGHAGFSHVSGSAEAITGLQESSTHYFQRPDQDHVEIDPAATSLSGWTAAIRGGKRSGSWRWNGGVWADSPGFDINDAGQLGRADDIAQWWGVNYRDTEPGSTLRSWVVGVFGNNSWNFDGVVKNRNVGFWSEWTFSNFWFAYVGGGHNLRVQSDTQTRGGPLMARPSNAWFDFELRNNDASRSRWRITFNSWRDELDGYWWRTGAELSTQPSDRLTISTEPRYSRSDVARQFIDSFDGGPDATFGTRYVFGRIDRSEIAAPVRANYAFTPDMTLELYAEPFAASGSYSGFGELAAPRSFDLRTYGVEEGTSIERDDEGDLRVVDGTSEFAIEDPDFNVLSFRSNLVLRWEWRPGSTLFLVWQQNRSALEDTGERVGTGDLADAISADGENVLAVKFSYWLPL